MKRFGSGWAWLVVGKDGKLAVVSTANQDNPISQGQAVVLGCDVWEHAYYLKYQNKRADYLAAFWNFRPGLPQGVGERVVRLERGRSRAATAGGEVRAPERSPQVRLKRRPAPGDLGFVQRRRGLRVGLRLLLERSRSAPASARRRSPARSSRATRRLGGLALVDLHSARPSATCRSRRTARRRAGPAATFRSGLPWAKIMPSFLAPVMPKSACDASPMPFTAQPEHGDLDRVARSAPGGARSRSRPCPCRTEGGRRSGTRSGPGPRSRS